LPPPLHGSLGALGSALVLLIGLIVALAGKAVARLVAFLVGGAALGLFLYQVGLSYSAHQGQIIPLILGLLGFLVGGILGVLLLPVAVGLGLGFVFFSVASSLFGGFIVPLISGLIGFVIGVVLSKPVLVVVTAALGGYLVYIGLMGIGVERLLAIAGGGLIFILGLILQLR